MLATETKPQGPNMSLFGLERELLELLQYRDDLTNEVVLTAEAEAERQAALEAIDKQIAEYVKRQSIARADSVIAALRECHSRAAALGEEIERLAKLQRAAQDREARIKQYAAEALAATLDPQIIARAKQNNVLHRVEGRLGQLKLCKSPAAVEVTDESLVPDEHKRAIVTMPYDMWLLMKDSTVDLIDFEHINERVDVSKTDIGKALKAGEAVAGARLVEDNVHVRIS